MARRALDLADRGRPDRPVLCSDHLVDLMLAAGPVLRANRLLGRGPADTTPPTAQRVH